MNIGGILGYAYWSTINITTFSVTNTNFFVTGYNYIGAFAGQV
jgi:hypothetical protein